MAVSQDTPTLRETQSRRSFLALAGGVAAATAASTAVAVQSARADASDAELIRLGEEYERLSAIEDAAFDADDEALERMKAEMARRLVLNGGRNTTHEELVALEAETGRKATYDAHMSAVSSSAEVTERILAIEAVGFVGLAVKARLFFRVLDEYIAKECFDMSEDEPLEDMDWDKKVAVMFRREIERLAKLEGAANV